MTRFYNGQSLLGLMLSLILSSFLLLVIIQFYSYAQQQNRRQLLQLQLQTELQRALQTMAKDLRRAGFRALSIKVTQENFSLFELDEDGISLAIYPVSNESAVKNNCVLFFYDLDGNGCLGSTAKQCAKDEQNATSEVGRELFGYRQNGLLLESRTYGNKANTKCKKAECQGYLQQNACQDLGWTKMLDEDNYEITDLQLNWLDNSKQYKGLMLYLAGRLKQSPDIQYESSVVIPLLNQPILSE
ncbi:hypothetical protein FW755_09700 [Lonepinella koalarum]|uniref:hypothetical protein n=1 Tax=Lonepinella koalarum TaxID=53417 RepID=UPI0011E3EF00|nr:hypothetical protein [Lonepinella koalarum]TYG35339.1 hypothetical protein FW755_09700 [Lonepinella koalarum]